MRARNIIGGTVLGVTALFLAAPLASAETGSMISVEQGEFKPGQKVQIVSKCFAPNVKKDKFHSAALDSLEFIVKTHEVHDDVTEWSVFGTTKVRQDAKNGKHEVWYMCNGKKLVGHVTVVGAAAPQKKALPKPAAQVEATPKGSADTGGGGAVVETVAAPTQTESTNYTAIGLGSAGALAAAGAGVLAFRRRRASN